MSSNAPTAPLDATWLVRGHTLADFTVGRVFEHSRRRTLLESDNALFTTLTLHYNPLYLDREYARAAGFGDILMNPLLVFNTVFGISVEDLSERAIAHLGYEKMKWHETVYPGDTITSESLVLSKRDTSRPDRGVVKFRTTGYNQRGEKVLEYERPVLIRKRNPPA